MAGGPSAKKKKKTSKDSSEPSSSNPETIERRRLKTLAFSNRILSQTPAKPYSPLAPSKTAAKHHGADIVKKSHRKNRFLFSFPGLLAPMSGGKIGELKDLGSKNPILYIDFPQGRLKLFGTIVYPNNRYLTLQFARGKNVMCEDYFDNMIVFSDAWWIGREDENPEESRLDFPKELSDSKQAEYDFKGGAGGVASTNKRVGHKTEVTDTREKSPIPMLEDDSSDDDDNKVSVNVTPVRQSARTAGKKFKFAETSPEEDSIASDGDESDEDKKPIGKLHNLSAIFDIDGEEDSTPKSGPSGTESKESSPPVKVTKSAEDSSSIRGSLIQTTISTMFKKVVEKKTSRVQKKVPSPKGKKAPQSASKRNSDQDQDGPSTKKAKVVVSKNAGGKGKAKKKVDESEEDDIEEFSSASQDDGDESDEDWQE